MMLWHLARYADSYLPQGRKTDLSNLSAGILPRVECGDYRDYLDLNLFQREVADDLIVPRNHSVLLEGRTFIFTISTLLG